MYGIGGSYWKRTSYFSVNRPHIEAIKDESTLHAAACPPCIVHGCVNHRHQGRFIGDLCAPCHAYITSGRVGPTTSFLGKLNGLPPCPPDVKLPANESVAPDGLPPYPPVPVGYARWVNRGKGWRTDRKVCFAALRPFDEEWSLLQYGCTIGWDDVHYIEAVKD